MAAPVPHSTLEPAAIVGAPLPGQLSVSAFQQALTRAGEALSERFLAGDPVQDLVTARSGAIDLLIRQVWRLCIGASEADLSLVAVGGYGRGELHPCSDIDLMILTREGEQERFRSELEKFLTFLWDMGLEVGHSVRTLGDCVTAARDDITVATNLMEARLLAGRADLFEAMCEATGPKHMWDARAFFAAKWREQQDRHEKYHNTAYKLEPNVKEGPGGLRDIQTIGWVAKRHFGARTLHDLVDHGFLTQREYESLTRGQLFLWKVRFALHLLAGRREDRLLFDSQLKLARQFGYRDQPHSLGVELFMQDYYRNIMELRRLNEMLLQLFQEAILRPEQEEPAPLNARFQERHGYLEAAYPEVFGRHPSALLEMFHLLEQHPALQGVSAHTIRLVRSHLHLIDEAFRAEPAHRELFMAILREPRGVTHELRRMNRYGVLGRYIPAFGAVTGRMQYDLFHTYTVDEHILVVVSNLRRFALPRFNHEFPLCSELMQAMAKPEIAYLAGLFHDIAKGRGGDHSELGAVDAEAFCLDHGLSRYDARFVAWLVQNHLLLSITAQKKDITDPQVIHEFATRIGDQLHLDYLYLLTVADVRGTNPDLWNSWKASLFTELYEQTRRALRRGLENPIDKEELIAETQAAARRLLQPGHLDEATIQRVWAVFSEEYFLRHAADEIAWHTEALARHDLEEAPIILVRQSTARGGTAVSVYGPRDDFNFGRATAALDQLGLTILDARIIPLENGYTLDTYVVLEDTGEPIEEPDRVEQIRRVMQRETGRQNARPMNVTRRAPRQVRMFTTPTHIEFAEDRRNHRTVMEIIAGDRPGLLSEIGKILHTCHVRLQNAKITTVGERAEDVFFITDESNRPLASDARATLTSALMQALDSPA
ncbi:MAG: [protein-PII] uridylyltransferase [Gammaproteobacteria bacterium]|jgi:[protein-PII] uridylyltransferase